MIKLSYTSLNALYNGHEWINKQMGIQVPDYPFLKEGTEAHRIIQDHVSGKKKDKRLSHIEVSFPVVEEVDFDERCKFEFKIDDNYLLRGYIDGQDAENKRFLEIKTSSIPWSMTKFRDAMQRKIYALAKQEYKEAFIITGSKNPDEWGKNPPKLYSMELTKKDVNEALKWIKDGINILESGDFTGGLDENGKCTGCFYNMPRYRELANCNFI